MTLLQGFQKTYSKLSQANRTASYRSMNKALAKTQTFYSKQIATESGLKSAIVKPRFMSRKATKQSLLSYVSFGVKFGVPLSEFKPKAKTVKIGRGKSARKYQGVTVKLPSVGRVVAPKAFLWTTKSGKSLVLARKGIARNPLALPRYSLNDIAKKHQSAAKQMLKLEFERNFKTQLQYEIKKL